MVVVVIKVVAYKRGEKRIHLWREKSKKNILRMMRRKGYFCEWIIRINHQWWWSSWSSIDRFVFSFSSLFTTRIKTSSNIYIVYFGHHCFCCFISKFLLFLFCFWFNSHAYFVNFISFFWEEKKILKKKIPKMKEMMIWHHHHHSVVVFVIQFFVNNFFSSSNRFEIDSIKY